MIVTRDGLRWSVEVGTPYYVNVYAKGVLGAPWQYRDHCKAFEDGKAFYRLIVRLKEVKP